MSEERTALVGWDWMEEEEAVGWFQGGEGQEGVFQNTG